VSFSTYESYRGSGVEWVGNIPVDWDVKRFRFVFRESFEKIEKEAVGPMLSVSGYRGIEVKDYDDENRRRPEEELVGYRIVRVGQLVVNTMWLNYAGLGVSEHEGHVSPAYRSYWIDPSLNRRYVHHLLRSSIYVQGYTRLLTGIRPNSLQMSRDDMMDFPVLVPPPDDQAAIAAFLDHETAKIDALVEAQRRLVELLNEKRQAVISQAVTKGLDPTAPMGDTGVKWLGEVPKHWKVKRLKHAAVRVVDCLHTTPSYDGELRYPAIRTADIGRGTLRLDQARLVSTEVYTDRIQRLRPEVGDILYSREGERFGLAALIPPGVELCLGQRMMMFRLSIEFDPSYVMWALNSESVFQQVLETVGGATSPHVNISDIVNFYLPAPPLDEQRQIAVRIREKVRQIDQLLAEAEKANGLLDEKRAALISAVVTGKIDVCSAAVSTKSTVEQSRLRLIVGAAIIEALADKPNSGRTKPHKLVYLAQTHAGVHDLNGAYTRQAAGPLDADLLHQMESDLRKAGHISIEQPGGPGSQVSYKICGKRGAFRNEFDAALGAKAKAVDKLIADLGDLDTKHVEAIVTLYAVWNDALLDGGNPNDDTVVSGVLNEWHPEKRQKFGADELHTWLGWMRRHGLIPQGRGPRTTTGRLFA
jgi:type I restriction enzyme S subunit